jgi:hypothetical protein
MFLACESVGPRCVVRRAIQGILADPSLACVPSNEAEDVADLFRQVSRSHAPWSRGTRSWPGSATRHEWPSPHAMDTVILSLCA